MKWLKDYIIDISSDVCLDLIERIIGKCDKEEKKELFIGEYYNYRYECGYKCKDKIWTKFTKLECNLDEDKKLASIKGNPYTRDEFFLYNDIYSEIRNRIEEKNNEIRKK